MNDDALPENSWFCNICSSSRNPRQHDDESGAFGALLANLEKTNPSAFHLPKDIREFFEDVKTGPDGEYEEITAPKPK
jgi:hypothetical protein